MNSLRTDSQLDFLYNSITSYICGLVKVAKLHQYHRATQDGDEDWLSRCLLLGFELRSSINTGPTRCHKPPRTIEITWTTSAATCERGLIYTKLRIWLSTLEFDTKT